MPEALASSNVTRSYILVSGQGRSGSNRLLDILDLSPTTVCRSEVNEIAGSDFAAIKGTLFEEDLTPKKLEELRIAILGAKGKQSARDRLYETDKAFIGPLARRLMFPMTKARVRQALHRMYLLRHSNEWPYPNIFLDQEQLQRATLVLKLNSCPAWTSSLLQHDRACRVIHNIRTPIDYLQSWYNRFIYERHGYASFKQNFNDVPRILAHFGRTDADRLSTPNDRNLVEVELWRWRYVNESLLELETACPDRYLRLVYSDIDTDPIEATKQTYKFADLVFDDITDQNVRSMKNMLFKKPHATKLDTKLSRELIDLVLRGSPLCELLSLG